MNKKGVKQLGYSRKSINYMTKKFNLDEFFQTKEVIGIILITPKQIAISYGKIDEGLIHSEMIQEMLKVLKIKGDNSIIAIRCYVYSNGEGGCIPLSIKNRIITQDMYKVVDKIYERVIDISKDIMVDNAKELVEIENLKIDNSITKYEKIIGIKLKKFMKRLDSKYRKKEKIKQQEKGTKKVYKIRKLDEYKIANSDNNVEKKAIKQL